MNIISLWQPWASAIAVGLKTIETRSWCAPRGAIGQPLAIAAAKRDTPELRAWWMKNVRAKPEILEYFLRAGFSDWDALPKGNVVCTTRLLCSVSTDADPPLECRPCPTDEMWGDFSPHRFAWFLGDIKRLFPGIPVVGRQGIFTWAPSPVFGEEL